MLKFTNFKWNYAYNSIFFCTFANRKRNKKIYIMKFTFDDILKKLEIDKKYVEFLKNMETPLSNEALTRYILALNNAHNQLVKDMIDDCVKDVEMVQKTAVN